MVEAWNFILSVITQSYNWLSSWQFHGVSFAGYLIGYAILIILIDRLF